MPYQTPCDTRRKRIKKERYSTAMVELDALLGKALISVGAVIIACLLAAFFW